MLCEPHGLYEEHILSREYKGFQFNTKVKKGGGDQIDKQIHKEIIH